MALDALAVKALTAEFNEKLTGLRIDKIYQPESDELILSLHATSISHKLLLSANANIPRACITTETRENPASPPMFCMLLRKHLLNGKIESVLQPDFERIIEFLIETKNDFGDTVIKKLVIEIMGRHSNIILIDENNRVLSSIKHVDFSVSSIRQLLTGAEYEYPPVQEKHSPLILGIAEFTDILKHIPEHYPVDKFISSTFMGISALSAREIAYKAGLLDKCGGEIDFSDSLDLATSISTVFRNVNANTFKPCIIENAESGKLIDFSSIEINQYENLAKITYYDSISEVIDSFYKIRSLKERMAVKSASLLKLVTNNLSRSAKKYEIQLKELADSSKKEAFRIKGELITANMYKIKKGDDCVSAVNYNSPDMEEILIELDKTLSPSANAQKYFKRYNKLKNAEIFLTEEIKKTKSELLYLETVEEELSKAKSLADLNEIRDELSSQGYIRSQSKNNKGRKKSNTYSPEIKSFVTEDGFTVFIGKNNKQNDYLTFKMSRGTDLWFHTKDIPGSHVVLRHEHEKDFTQKSILEAACAAAFNSKAKNSNNVPVDYTYIKNVKKPSGARPGFVIFTDNKTLYVSPNDYE